MMRLYFGNDSSADLSVDEFFNSVYEPEWFDDNLVKEMVLDIDKSKVVSRNVIDSPVLGQIPPQWLSGGVKGLIMLLKYDATDNDYIFKPELAIFGNNCMKWLGIISRIRDFEASIDTFDLDFPGGNILCINDGKTIENSEQWEEKLNLI